MAEAWHPNFIGEDNPITCIKCFLSFEPPSWLKVPINQYLLSISDTIGGFEYSSDYYFDTARVPFQFYCPKCNHNNITVAEVSADAVWNHDEIMEGRAPRIVNFYDIRIITVSPSIGISTSSCLLRESFKFGCEYDIEHAEDITSNLTYDPNHLVVFRLRIIAKTTMKGGFCYLALDQLNGRILRPVFNISDGLCCWPKKTIELKLGHLYNFQVIAHPDQAIQRNYTPVPHKNEDIIVTELVEDLSSFQPLLTQSPLKFLLFPLARLDIQDIFGPNVIKQNGYVDENTNCKSAGILRSKATVYTIKYKKNKKKCKCKVECPSGTYIMPVTAIDVNTENIYPDALIVLGLSRPFKGGIRWYPKYCPARCVLLVVGIYPLP